MGICPTLLMLPCPVRNVVGTEAGTVGGSRLIFSDVNLFCEELGWSISWDCWWEYVSLYSCYPVLRNLVGTEAKTVGANMPDFNDVTLSCEEFGLSRSWECGWEQA